MSEGSPADFKVTSSSTDRESQQDGVSIPRHSNEGFHDRIARMRENFPEDDDFLSPIGSPTEMSFMGGRDKFMELKRKLEDDQAQSQMSESTASENPIEADVDSFLDSFRLDRSRSFNMQNMQSGSVSMSAFGAPARIENHPKFLELYQQIKDRDHKILTLETKMMESDRIVMELKDTIQQKEKMIGSKNEAASVIQTKCQKELDNKEEELKQTQKTLFDIEKNFSNAQDAWKSEKDRLNLELQHQIEKVKQLEAGKFEMVTKTAELQEAMVILETQKEDIIKQTEYRHAKELEAKDAKIRDIESKYTKDMEEKESKIQELESTYRKELAKVKELERVVAEDNKEKEESFAELHKNHMRELEEKDEKLDMLEEILAKDLETHTKELETKDKQLKESIKQHSEELKEKENQLQDVRKHSYELEEKETQLQEVIKNYGNELEEKKQFIQELLDGHAKGLEEKNKQIKELSDSLDKAKGLVQKLKMRYQTKVAALKESSDNQNNEAELKAKIVSLENHVAELEEEKGNLLLHLVDFDELQAAHAKLVEELSEYKQSHSAQTEELTNLRETVRDLHAKGVTAEYQLNEKCSQVQRLEVELQDLSQRYNDERVNYQLSMAAAEEPFGFSDGILEEVENLRVIKQKYDQVQNQLVDLEQSVLSRDSLLQQKDSDISLWAARVQVLEKKCEEEESMKINVQEDLRQAKEQIVFASQKEEVMLMQYDEQARQTQEQVASLQKDIEMREIAMNQFKKDIKSYEEATRLAQEQVLALQIDVQSLEEMISQKDSEIEKLVTSNKIEIDQLFVQEPPQVFENVVLQDKVQELSEFASQYTESAADVEHLEAEFKLSQDKLENLQMELEMRETTLAQYMNDIRAYDEATRLAQEEVVTLQDELKARDELLSVRSKELQELMAKLEQIEKERMDQSHTLEQMRELEKRNEELNRLIGSNQTVVEECREMIKALNHKVQDYETRNNYLELKHEEICNDLSSRVNKEELMVKEHESQIEVKNRYIENLTLEKDDNIRRLKEDHDQILALLNDKNDNITELMNSCSELKFLFEEKVEELNACAARKEEEIQMAVQQYDAQTKQAQEQLLSMQLDIQARDELLTRQKNEINSYSEQNIHAQEQIISLQLDIQSRDELINQKKNEVNELSSKLNEYENSRVAQDYSVEQKFKDLNDYIIQKEDELRTVILQFEDQKKQAQEQILIFQQDIRQRDELLSQQRKEAEYNWNQANEQLSNLASYSQAEIQEKNELLEKLQKDVKLLTEMNSQAQEQIIMLQMDIISRDETLSTRANEITLLNAKVDDLEKIEAAQNQVILQSHGQKNTIEQLSRELEHYKVEKAEFDSLRNTCVNLQSKLLEVTADGSARGPVPVVEPEFIKPTTYLTTDASAPVEGKREEEKLQLEEERLKQQNEIRELKVRNGKMMQKFKQLKDRYESILKENESLKNKNEFSLESALQDELLGQVKKHESVIEEKAKMITDLQAEKDKLLLKVDIMERANDKLTEVKDYQDKILEDLTQHKRQLEQEISGLKWRLDEVVSNPPAPVLSEIPFAEEPSLHSSSEGNEVVVNSLRQQNAALVQELEVLQKEIAEYKEEMSQLTYRIHEMEAEMKELPPRGDCDGEAATSTPTQQQTHQDLAANISAALQAIGDQSDGGSSYDNAAPVSLTATSVLPAEVPSLQLQLETERAEKVILERKIELLQEKISEIEGSEMKCYEENMALRSYSRRLEMDNLNHLTRWDELKYSEGSMSSLKEKALYGEVIRLVEALQSRDQRCEELTIEITRLLEERDGLQLKLSNVLKHNVNLYEEVNKGQEQVQGDVPSFDKEALKMKLAELEQINFNINMDLRREKKARHLMQEQLFFSQASRVLIRGSGIEPIPNAPPSPQRPMTPVRTSYTPSPPSSPSSPASFTSPPGANVQTLPTHESLPQNKSPVSNVQTGETEPSSNVKHI